MESTPSDTVVDTGLEAEFTDDEIDADMFDDEVDPDNSVSDKTVALSVVEGQSYIR
jgi:E3 ubiquitin-protein ligase TRIP12